MERLTRDPSSRGASSKLVGGTGAAGALSLFLAACGSDDKKTDNDRVRDADASGRRRGDLKIVNYALTLEYLETAFYKDVVAERPVQGQPTLGR